MKGFLGCRPIEHKKLLYSEITASLSEQGGRTKDLPGSVMVAIN